MKRTISWNAKAIRRKHRYRFFISHATDDKHEIVMPVLKEMKKLGLSYFIDHSDIKWGASLHRNLSQGLNKSQYFVAFISHAYLQKRWTMLELDAALHRQVSEGTAFILPILVGSKNQREHLLMQLPLLANMLHLVWDNDPAMIAISLAERLKQKDRP